MSDQQANPPEERRDDRGPVSPPTTLPGILRQLGPGLIIAGSIVGSGELIATTATGAQAGFYLLWLILIGCVIKVFVQIEFGRYALITGKTTIYGMNEVPGPRIAGHGNWLVWFWLLMFLAGLAQLGGIVGGVGQALQISMPLTESGRRFNELLDAETRYTVALAELELVRRGEAAGDETSVKRAEQLRADIAELGRFVVETRLAVARGELRAAQEDSAAADGSSTTAGQLESDLAAARQRVDRHGMRPERVFDGKLEHLGRRTSYDDRIWAAIITVITSVLLVVGRYGLVQAFSAVMVATFTVITVINLVLLQGNESWSVDWSDIVRGMSFRLPPSDAGSGPAALATALATFGIIGVGASELIAYPYWCLEKGYARFTGLKSESPEWAERARGWMRVMRYDAWCSMVVYTFATVAFYLLGAAVLGRTHLNPKGTEMIRMLSVMYEPVFGPVAQWLFLFGALAVLYSTFFVATAGHARVFPDALRVFGILPDGEKNRQMWVRFFSGLFPFVCLAVYLFVQRPVLLILISGIMQAVILPMLAGAALFFRYRRCDRRIMPGRFWDLFLWLSSAGMLIAGVWAAWESVAPYVKFLLD